MEKMSAQSLDGAALNLERLEALFPDAVTETEGGRKAADFERLRDLLSGDPLPEDDRERYRFTWPGKRNAVREANTPVTLTLNPVPERSRNFDATGNLYIEGDALNSLKVLRKSYLSKVKMIYIDPPYNTGKDFIYSDNYRESRESYKDRSGSYDEEGNLLFDRMKQNTESNGRFHTDWLNMIYPMLKVARDLLTPDGVIFISIDDHEVHNLRKVCDEIFGESNFVAEIAWRRTDNQSNISSFAKVKEYILLYAKSPDYILGKLPLSEKAKFEYRYSDDKGTFRRGILLHKTRGRKYFPVTTKLGTTLNGPWMVTEEQFKDLQERDMLYWAETSDGQPYKKIYLQDSEGQVPNDFWGIEFGTNQRGSLEVEKLFERRIFDFPKPVSLIQNMCAIGTDRDSVVLDFFSGSGTTGHAVMQLNAEDGGRRKFILVQVPEQTDAKSEAFKAGYRTICEIGEERLRRAGDKISKEAEAKSRELEGTLFAGQSEGEGVKGGVPDTGFRVLRLTESNVSENLLIDPATAGQEQLIAGKWREGVTELDLLFEAMRLCGLPLSEKITEETLQPGRQHIYRIDAGEGDAPYLIASFDATHHLDENAVEELAKRKPLYFVTNEEAAGGKDEMLDNIEQIFLLYSPDTLRYIL